jgi:hypothetical protein
MDCALAVESPTAAELTTTCDVAVIGAGPYGLSTAAHLIARGLSVEIFGKPLELWREHMPAGMRLRSHWWATSLSDPTGAWSFGRFLDADRRRIEYPVPIDTFIEYGAWFQRHATPQVDATYVSSVAREGKRFQLALADGRQLQAGVVVVATGLHAFAHRGSCAGLPAALASHTADHCDLRRFRSQTVVVVGGGQSAIESAALLVEAGANVHVVARRPIHWLSPDRDHERGLIDALLAPRNAIAPGWTNWALERLPYLFYRAPQARKDRWNSGFYLAAASDWLRGRVLGKAVLHEGCSIAHATPRGDAAVLALSNGTTIEADNVIFGTGYRVNLNRMTMLDPGLRAEIASDAGVPVLSSSFESSVPGLYFVGLASLRAFGPLFRFVAGCAPTARRVTASIWRRAPKF